MSSTVPKGSDVSVGAVSNSNGNANSNANSSGNANNVRHNHQYQSESTSGRAASLISVDDWDLLFNAVQERIESAIKALHSTGNCCEEGSTDTSKVKATLIECVGELKRLHTALSQERSARVDVQR